VLCERRMRRRKAKGPTVSALADYGSRAAGAVLKLKLYGMPYFAVGLFNFGEGTNYESFKEAAF